MATYSDFAHVNDTKYRSRLLSCGQDTVNLFRFFIALIVLKASLEIDGGKLTILFIIYNFVLTFKIKKGLIRALHQQNYNNCCHSE